MVGTMALTQTTLRLELVALEMQSVNDRSLKDQLLNEIIAFCVPRRYIESFAIYGFEGDEAHLRLDVVLDYDEHDQQVKLSGEGLPDGTAGTYALEYGPAADIGEGSQPRCCPHMGKAVDLFIRLATDKGLRLRWAVRFRDKRQEMCEKFGLGPAIIRDGTGDGDENIVTSTFHPELSVRGRVSRKILPSE